MTAHTENKSNSIDVSSYPEH